MNNVANYSGGAISGAHGAITDSTFTGNRASNGGAVVAETRFAWPGVGRLAVGAIVSSDFPTAQGAIMILAIAFLSINLLVDVLYVYLDPRVQRR